MRTLLIRRRGYRRKGYRRKDGVYVSPADVPGVLFRARDRGAPGRGRRVITGLKKGAMTKQAINLGYITEDQRVGDIPKGKMDDFALDLAKEVGRTRALRMVNAQLIFRKRSPDGFKEKILVAKTTLQKSRVLKVKRKK